MRGKLGSEAHENLIVGVLIHAKFNHLNFAIRTLGFREMNQRRWRISMHDNFFNLDNPESRIKRTLADGVYKNIFVRRGFSA